MSAFSGRRVALVAPVVTLIVGLALTGCSRLGAADDTASTTSGAVAPAPTTSTAGVDPSTLAGISSDLGTAGTANQQADTDAAAADQAAATNDQP